MRQAKEEERRQITKSEDPAWLRRVWWVVWQETSTFDMSLEDNELMLILSSCQPMKVQKIRAGKRCVIIMGQMSARTMKTIVEIFGVKFKDEGEGMYKRVSEGSFSQKPFPRTRFHREIPPYLQCSTTISMKSLLRGYVYLAGLISGRKSDEELSREFRRVSRRWHKFLKLGSLSLPPLWSVLRDNHAPY